MSSNFDFDPLKVAGSGHYIRITAGENLTNRQLVYLNADGNYYLADASAVATSPALGIVIGNITAGTSGLALIKGYLGLSTWTWTVGATLYLSDVAGAMGEAAGTLRQEVGHAVLATQIWFDPQNIDTGGAGGVTHAYRYIYPIDGNDQAGANPPTIARVYMRPFQVFVPMTVDRLGIMVTTANGNVRVGIYRDNGDTPVGGALVVESASTALAVNILEITIASTVLTAGLYWLAIQCDDNTASLNRIDQVSIIASAGGTLRVYSYLLGGGYAAFDDPCPASGATANYPWVCYVRVASVP